MFNEPLNPKAPRSKGIPKGKPIMEASKEPLVKREPTRLSSSRLSSSKEAASVADKSIKEDPANALTQLKVYSLDMRFRAWGLGLCYLKL